MTKNTDSVSGVIDRHYLPQGMQEIHRQYGLWILGHGRNLAGKGSWRCNWRKFEFYSLSFLLEGAGTLIFEGHEEIPLVPGDLVTVLPGALNRYGGSDEASYLEISICFYGPVADMLCAAGVICNGVTHLGDPASLLKIQDLVRDPAETAQIHANLELQKLLIRLYDMRCNPANMQSLDALLTELQDNPDRWWTISDMAQRCNCSTDQLRRNFLKRTGLLPKAYVDRLKMTRAAELLADRDRRIEEIAQKVGFLDPFHFSRRFKAVMGFSPQRYRKEIYRMP